MLNLRSTSMFEMKVIFFKLHRTFVPPWNCSSGRLSTLKNLYSKALYKKFVFQVHPDYFTNFKPMQAVNADNLSILQNMIDGNLASSDVAREVKSLIFFIKPPFADSQPKRVQVNVNRIENSIIEILQTVGVDLPIRTEGFRGENVIGHNSTTVLASPQQILDYLESMCERRDLIAWREDRIKELAVVEKVSKLFNWA